MDAFNVKVKTGFYVKTIKITITCNHKNFSCILNHFLPGIVQNLFGHLFPLFF